MLAMYSRPVGLLLAIAVSLGACGSQAKQHTPPSAPPPVPPPIPAPAPPPQSPEVTVTGDERIGWSQMIASGASIGDYRFFIYIDGRGSSLSGVQCEQKPDADGYPCAARLPPLTDGRHMLNISAVRHTSGPDEDVESPRSVRLIVVKGAALRRGQSASAFDLDPALAGAVAAGPRTAVAARTDPAAIRREVVASRLAPVTDLTALPDGRILIAELTGRVRVLTARGLDEQPLIELRGLAPGGPGLVGIAPHPRFATNHLLYFLYAADRGGMPMFSIARGREVNGRLGELAVLLEPAAAGSVHAGAIRFGRDGRLYVALPSAADDGADASGSFAGKVLRLNDDGSTPADNPGSSPVYSSGHRIPLGLAIDPVTGGLFVTDSARTGLVRLIRAGANHAAGLEASPPLVDFGPAAVPAGIIVYSGSSFPDWNGQILVARHDGGGIERLGPGAPSRASLVALGVEYGRIRALVQGRDGAVYFGTANGLASTSLADRDQDRVVRISPAEF